MSWAEKAAQPASSVATTTSASPPATQNGVQQRDVANGNGAESNGRGRVNGGSGMAMANGANGYEKVDEGRFRNLNGGHHGGRGGQGGRGHGGQGGRGHGGHGRGNGYGTHGNGNGQDNRNYGGNGNGRYNNKQQQGGGRSDRRGATRRNLKKWRGNKHSHPQTATSLDEEVYIPWDQFEANNELFGVKSTYNENFYTTRLDKNSDFYKDNEEKAARLARRIKSQSTSNIHMMEERGKIINSVSEEDRFSTVLDNSPKPDFSDQVEIEENGVSEPQTETVVPPQEPTPVTSPVEEKSPPIEEVEEPIVGSSPPPSSPQPIASEESASPATVNIAAAAVDASASPVASGEEAEKPNQSKSSLNPNAKVFTMNPNAEVFKPVTPPRQQQPQPQTPPPVTVPSQPTNASRPEVLFAQQPHQQHATAHGGMGMAARPFDNGVYGDMNGYGPAGGNNVVIPHVEPPMQFIAEQPMLQQPNYQFVMPPQQPQWMQPHWMVPAGPAAVNMNVNMGGPPVGFPPLPPAVATAAVNGGGLPMNGPAGVQFGGHNMPANLNPAVNPSYYPTQQQIYGGQQFYGGGNYA